MRRVTAGPYRGFPQRFVAAFERDPELFERVKACQQRGINLLEDDAYGGPPDPERAARLVGEHASGAVPLAALRAAREELELERLKWRAVELALELEAEEGPAALMIRANEVVDLAEARAAAHLVAETIARLDEHLSDPQTGRAGLNPALEATRRDLLAIGASEAFRQRLATASKPLREALSVALELAAEPCGLHELAELVAALVPPEPDRLNALHNLLGDRSVPAVSLADGRYMPSQTALRGIQLRLIPAPAELKEGVLALERHLPEFLLTPARDAFSLIDSAGQDVIEAVFHLGSEGTAADVGRWFERERFELGDDVVLAITDFTRRVFTLRREPHAARPERAIGRVTRALAAALAGLLERTPGRSAYVHEILPTAWARLPALKSVAAEPLSMLVLAHPRLDLVEESILRLRP